MFERFNEQARQAVVLAQEEARDLRHDYIGAQHLLLGVMRADPELAAVDPAEIRALLEPGEGDSPDQMPFSAVAKRGLEQALREAMALGHRRISPAHILLALAAERAVRDLLGQAGADELIDRERTTARAIADQHDRPAHDPRTDARLVAAVLEAGGPVATLLRDHGVDEATLQPFLET